MILEKIRAAFPETTRTEEQDLLIGSTCLALTDQERDTIENLSFTRYHSSLDEKKREDLSVKVDEAVAETQTWGTASGFATGGVTAGASAWFLAAFTPLVTAASGVGGAISGALIGHSLGGRIGYRRAIKSVTNTPEFVRWKDEKYATVILPALSRYVDPDQESKIQLTCPITWDWMIEPVQAEDGYIYEKAAITEHLIHWADRAIEMIELRQIQARAPLSSQEEQELLHTRSPFRNGKVTTQGLKLLPGFYEEIFEKLVHTYNVKVLEQQFIAAHAENIPQPFTEEVYKVVKFYEKTQRERSIIAADMHYSDLLRSSIYLSDKEMDLAFEFLSAATKPPRLLKTVI